MYFLTLLFIFLLLVFCVIILKEDIISPSVMFCFGYLFSLFLLPISYYYFEYKVGIETYLIIVFGSFFFVFISQLVKYLVPRKVFNSFKVESLKPIKISSFSYMLFLLFQFFTILYLFNIFNTSVNFNYDFSDLSTYINKFRNMLVSKNIDNRLVLPFALNQCIKISKCLSYIFIYIYFNNSIYNKKYLKNFYLLFPVIIYCILELLTGARFAILEFIVASIFLYVFFSAANGKKIKFRIKNIRLFLIVFLFLVLIFQGSRYIVDTSQNDELLKTIAFYFGNPIILLDMFIENFNGTYNVFFGQESFYNIYSFLDKVGIVNYPYNIHLEFRFYKGNNLGNVYTGYRSLINDFGYIGMFIMHAIFSILINLFYYYVRYKKRKPIDIFFIFYLYLASMPLLHFFNGRFFYIFSINYLSIFVTIFIISVVLNAKFVKL